MNNVLPLREISSRRQVQRLDGAFLVCIFWGQGTSICNNTPKEQCLGSRLTSDEDVKNLTSGPVQKSIC